MDFKELMKMNNKGQAGVGLILTIGVCLLIAVVYLMIYQNLYTVVIGTGGNGALNAGTGPNAGNAGLALLNTSTTTIMPLIVLIFGLVGVVFIVLTLANRQGQ